MKPRLLRWALIASLALNVLLSGLWLERVQTSGSSPPSHPFPDVNNGFQDYEIVAFVRDFAERITTFESETYQATQVAATFLMSEDLRGERLKEVQRVSQKMQNRKVGQRGRLMYLVRSQGDEERYRARVRVDLFEAEGAVKSEFEIEMSILVRRVERNVQNPWGFLVASLEQSVSKSPRDPAERENERVIAIVPNRSVLMRFPCVIENVELPKGTPLRVKLTTFDISEVQIRTEHELMAEQVMTSVCRDRIFRVKFQRGDAKKNAIVALKAFSLEDSTTGSNRAERKPRSRSEVERSIEEQLGFVIEGD